MQSHLAMEFLQETLRKYPRLMWLDSSIRFLRHPGNLSHVAPQLAASGGVLLLVRTSHSVYGATHRGLYQFFPADLDKVKRMGNGTAESKNTTPIGANS